MSTSRRSLTRYAWLAIAAALVTIGLKLAAWRVTGSVGLLSDALESIVNLVAAIGALITLTIAQREPDEDHAYGHGKAEYFSSGLEGLLIVVAAGSIVWTALPRLADPVPLESIGVGVAISIGAALVNLVVARVLMSAGRRHRSITLEADAHHLMTDVWTSAGVIAAIAAVALTGWDRLDPLIALIVAANICRTGYDLVRRSLLGLLDTAIPPEELAVVTGILRRFQETDGVESHALRTRQAGARRFVSVHILVPGEWTVGRGHQVAERVEQEIRTALPGTTVSTHIEPIDEDASWTDAGLDGNLATTVQPHTPQPRTHHR